MFKSFITKPDVILMDFRMPFKNGLEVTKEILKIDNNSKIIFTSADNSIKNLALSIGVISFKEKPFKHEKLIKNINKIIEN